MEMKISELIEIFKDIQEKEGDILLDCNLTLSRSLEVKGTFEANPGEIKKLMELFDGGE